MFIFLEVMSTIPKFQTKDVTISPVALLEEIMVMEHLCFNFPWSEDDYIEMRKQSSFKNWLLKTRGGFSVGFLVFQCIPDELQILRLGIHPQWRNRGYAHFLMAQLEIFACLDNIKEVYLEVHESNKSAITLYVNLKYKKFGRRRKYFQSPVGDAILFKKILNPIA